MDKFTSDLLLFLFCRLICRVNANRSRFHAKATTFAERFLATAPSLSLSLGTNAAQRHPSQVARVIIVLLTGVSLRSPANPAYVTSTGGCKYSLQSFGPPGGCLDRAVGCHLMTLLRLSVEICQRMNFLVFSPARQQTLSNSATIPLRAQLSLCSLRLYRDPGI